MRIRTTIQAFSREYPNAHRHRSCHPRLPRSSGLSRALLLSDHAKLTKEASTAPVQTVRYKYKYKRYAVVAPRRCNWQCYPYWRPYQYRYWQFYYPYGGPLF